jgi:hypothetical protein
MKFGRKGWSAMIFPTLEKAQAFVREAIAEELNNDKRP